jgi:uncharacterized protein YjiS (DUF1127 family)
MALLVDALARRLAQRESLRALARQPRRRMAAALLRALHRVRLGWRRHRERRQLLALDARLLRDIGLSRSDAEREWRKPFWQD